MPPEVPSTQGYYDTPMGRIPMRDEDPFEEAKAKRDEQRYPQPKNQASADTRTDVDD